MTIAATLQEVWACVATNQRNDVGKLFL